MTSRRGRISAQLMEALQILKFSIRKGRPLRFTEGMSWVEELTEFELRARVAPTGEAEAYGRSLEEPEEDSDDLMDALDELRNDLKALDEELMEELEDESEDLEDDEDIYA